MTNWGISQFAYKKERGKNQQNNNEWFIKSIKLGWNRHPN